MLKHPAIVAPSILLMMAFSKFQFQIKNNLSLGFRMENFRDEGEKRRFLTKTARGSPMKKVGTS